MKTTSTFKPSKIIIFEEADGFHWDIKGGEFLDGRGKGYPSRAEAMRAARCLFDDFESYLSPAPEHCKKVTPQ